VKSNEKAYSAVVHGGHDGVGAVVRWRSRGVRRSELYWTSG
jgi:hypothetical protein